MTRKSITTSHAAVACDVCGRTLLRGEHADPFIAAGARRMVCELCTARAANEGWIREGADNALGVRRNGSRAGRSLRDRLRARPGATRDETIVEVPEPPSRHGRGGAKPAPSASVPEAQTAAAKSDRADVAPQPAEPAIDAAVPDSPDARQVRGVPTNADLKTARAIDAFNASAHPRRIAGVARSLGPPAVAVLPSSSEGAIVSIVVGWELCWYRYEVDLADEAAGVRVIAQGAELTELTAEELVGNAVADDRGMLGPAR